MNKLFDNPLILISCTKNYYSKITLLKMEGPSSSTFQEKIVKNVTVQDAFLQKKIRRKEPKEMLIAVIGDEDTCVCYILAGIGDMDHITKENNFFVAGPKTTKADILQVWKNFVQRNDIAIVFINQCYANMIRDELNAYKGIFPTVVELPSVGQPFDYSNDPFFKKLDEGN